MRYLSVTSNQETVQTMLSGLEIRREREGVRERERERERGERRKA